MAFPIQTTMQIGEEVEANEIVFDTSAARLVCPVCAEEYTHVHSAFTSFGTDPDEGGHPIPGTRAHGVRSGWRRDALVISVWCEYGHAWQLILQQHKGQTLLLCKRLPDSPEMREVHE